MRVHALLHPSALNMLQQVSSVSDGDTSGRHSPNRRLGLERGQMSVDLGRDLLELAKFSFKIQPRKLLILYFAFEHLDLRETGKARACLTERALDVLYSH